jgi:hypothetical protein
MEPPGDPWIKGMSPTHCQNLGTGTTRGMKVFHHAETGEHTRTHEDLQFPWVRGPSRAARDRLSETRLSIDVSPSSEVREKISATLTGTRHPWREGSSRAAAVLAGADRVYILSLTDDSGKTFGKWGSTNSRQWKRRLGLLMRQFAVEIIHEADFGRKLAPEMEAKMGRLLSAHSLTECPDFIGKTETFEWNTETENIVKTIIEEHDHVLFTMGA